jgi:hypothetical protein
MTIEILLEEIRLLYDLIDSIKDIDLCSIEIKDSSGRILIIKLNH